MSEFLVHHFFAKDQASPIKKFNGIWACIRYRIKFSMLFSKADFVIDILIEKANFLFNIDVTQITHL